MREFGLSIALLGGASMCSASSGGPFINLTISDEFTAPGETASSVGEVQNAEFRSFIAATLEHLGGIDDPGQSIASGLSFERIAISASGDNVPAMRTFAARPDNGGCAIRSPWLEATVSPDGGTIRGLVHWNERQILRDRAILDGIAPPDDPPRAFSRGEFFDYSQRYAHSLTHGTELAEGEIPSDLLWLFRHSPQSTRGPFSTMASGAMQKISRDSVQFYGDLVAALLDRCRQAPGKTTEVRDITDLRDAIDLERVRTTT